MSVLLVQPIAKSVRMRPLARLINVTLDMRLMVPEDASQFVMLIVQHAQPQDLANVMIVMNTSLWTQVMSARLAQPIAKNALVVPLVRQTNVMMVMDQMEVEDVVVVPPTVLPAQMLVPLNVMIVIRISS